RAWERVPRACRRNRETAPRRSADRAEARRASGSSLRPCTAFGPPRRRMEPVSPERPRARDHRERARSLRTAPFRLFLDRRRSTLGGFFAFDSRSVLCRRELARLGIGIERLGEALGLAALFLGHLAQDVDALLLQLGFVVRAGDVRLDVDA